MKIRYLSDLHYGVNRIPHLILPPQPDEKILILAGDVMDEGYYGVDHITNACKQWEKVILLLGNHEYYYSSLEGGVDKILGQFDTVPDNLLVWDMGVYEEDTFGIVGATLWTNLDDMNWFAIKAAKYGMNDFRVIDKDDGGHVIDERDWYDLHLTHLKWIDLQYERLRIAGKKVIVVTHHAPSLKSVHPRFEGNTLNPAFVSDLDAFIMDRPEIKYWIHGHTHARLDYVIGTTNILCNPAGYRGELYTSEDLLQYDPVAHIVV